MENNSNNIENTSTEYNYNNYIENNNYKNDVNFNIDNKDNTYEDKILMLSINDISIKCQHCYKKIYLDIYNKKYNSIDSLLKIFTKKDRIFCTGILLLIIGLIFKILYIIYKSLFRNSPIIELSNLLKKVGTK